MAGLVNTNQTSSIKMNQKEEEIHCFVCDMLVTGRYYSLATCRAQSSKIRLIEKLGALVGDQYMVVISEDDIICRGCATFMNTLDRLESEALSIRSIVLKFLEKKYSLSEGELVNQKNTGLSQPPRIVPSQNPGREDLKPFSNRGSFMARKRKAALAQLADLGGDEQENIHKKRRSAADQWMQCGTCKYTTTYDSFLYHHMQDETTAKDSAIDPIMSSDTDVKTSLTMQGTTNIVSSKPTTAIHVKNFADPNSLEENSQDSNGSETVEMIAAEICDYNASKTLGLPTISDGDLEEPETIKVQIVSQGQTRKKYFGNNQKEVTIELPVLQEEVDLQNAEVITDQISEEDIDENTVYVQMVDVDKDLGLPVTDDGTVEMVEVMWDEMATPGAADENPEF